MSCVDELDYNPFFKALQEKFHILYETAQKECCLICIPRSDCLQGCVITEKCVQTHILKPSPFFKGQYTTLRSTKQTITVSDDGNFVITKEGFPIRTEIKVLFEELGYNKEYKPYKMLVIDRPLDINVLRKTATDAPSSDDVDIQYTLKECRQYLQTFKELAEPLNSLDVEIQKFLKSYVILKDYLHEAADRLQNIATSISETCLRCLKDRKLYGQKMKDAVTASVETCLLGNVHSKVYPVICSKFTEEDTMLLSKCQTLQGVRPEHLAVHKHFCCPLSAAVEVLQLLDDFQTPVEKLYCLKATIDNITEEVNIHIRDSQPAGVALADIPCLTSDELIPILVTVVVEAQCQHVHSDIYYIENFCWSANNKDADTLSYCLVTFQAALQYFMTTDFSDINLSPQDAKTSLKLAPLGRQTPSPAENLSQDPQDKMAVSKGARKSSGSSKPRFERQMEEISKMLKESTKEMGRNKQKPDNQPLVTSIFGSQRTSISPLPDTQQQTVKEETKDMGDFLSSLQNDMFLSFGKQS